MDALASKSGRLVLPVKEGSRESSCAFQRLRRMAGEPLLTSDWQEVVFLHLAVDREALQREVPFPLELFQGRAYVSLVAFTCCRMAPFLTGGLGKLAFSQFQIGKLLNVRTYVRFRSERGIYFLAEWLESRLHHMLGPRFYGLPYRLGRLAYDHERPDERLAGRVIDHTSAATLAYQGVIAGSSATADEGSIEEFLLERYTAFTWFQGRRRLFRIWHEPWRCAPLRVTNFSNELLTQNWPWMKNASLEHAHYSAGFKDVWMGRPLPIASTVRSAFLKDP